MPSARCPSCSTMPRRSFLLLLAAAPRGARVTSIPSHNTLYKDVMETQGARSSMLGWSPSRTSGRSSLASVVLIVMPGPSVLFVIGRSLALGRRGGLLSVSATRSACCPSSPRSRSGSARSSPSRSSSSRSSSSPARVPRLSRRPGDPASQRMPRPPSTARAHPLALAPARRGLHRGRHQPEDDRVLRRGAPAVRRLHRRRDPAAAASSSASSSSCSRYLRLTGRSPRARPATGSRARPKRVDTSARPAAS